MAIDKKGMTSFTDVAIGGTFHDGKRFGMGANSKTEMWEEFRKTTKSKAVCVKQVGYGNTRGEGREKSFAPFARVKELV